jgi:AraC-like DNA-binding protein
VATRERLFLPLTSRRVTWPVPDRATSLFRAADPGPRLRAHIAKIRWGHEWIPPEAPVQERILPDGAVHLLFAVSHGGPGYALALGATSEAQVVSLAGRIEHVEIELRPGAVPALLGVPAGELAGQVVPLEQLWGSRATSVRDLLLEERDPARRIDLVQAVLAQRAGQGEGPAVLGEALSRIGHAAGNLRVGALAADLGLSERRLEQLFHHHVGLSPKTTCRVARFRATVERLAAAPATPWVELALAAGFSDQAHLVNEFRAVSGLAPRELQQRAGFGFLQDRVDSRGYLRGKSTRRNGP